MLRAGIVLVASVCESVRRKSLLIRNRCNLVGVCPIGNARSDWKFLTFDFDLWPWELFSYFSNSGYTIRMTWPSSFIFSLEIYLQISRSRFSFKVMALRSMSRERKSGSMQLKNYWSEIAAAWSELCYDNARSNSELLRFWPWPLILRHIFIFFWLQALIYEYLKLHFQCENTSLEYLGHLRVSGSTCRFVLLYDTV